MRLKLEGVDIILGVKQQIEQDEWIETLKNIRKKLKEDPGYQKRIIRLKNKTKKEIKKKIARKKVAVSYSGGKDSIVVNHMCQQIGINRIFWVRTNLEYPKVVKWINRYGPDNLEIVNTGQDLKWLAKNQNMLFPQSKKIASIWYKIVQNTGQKLYFKENKIDMLIVGSRIKDGNETGKDGMKVNKHGIRYYSPIYDWSHEDLLAYIEYFNINLPSLYKWTNGFQVGTGPWAAREQTGTIKKGWREIYDIDPSIVKKAAKYITSAKRFLKSLE